MGQRLVKKPVFCAFYDGPCTKKECPAYEAVRYKTMYEQQCLLVQDIPVTDPYVRDWCSKYQRCVADRNIIEEYDE